MLIISIDDVCRLFQDYCGDVGVPTDAMPVKFMFNEQQRKLALVLESDEWTKNQPDEMVNFTVKRYYGVN